VRVGYVSGSAWCHTVSVEWVISGLDPHENLSEKLRKRTLLESFKRLQERSWLRSYTRLEVSNLGELGIPMGMGISFTRECEWEW